MLVIETLSMFGNPPAGYHAATQFVYTSDGTTQAAITLAPQHGFVYDGVHDSFADTQAVKAYIYPGSTMTIAVASDTVGPIPFGLTLSGYSVSCTSTNCVLP